jgi:hypothetical protein
MLLYNWKKIFKASGGSSKRILTILEAMLATKLPYNRYDPIYKYYYEDFSGYSYLKNPEYLLQYRYKYRDKEIADYIGLASFRNLGEYKAIGKLTLDLSHCPLREDALNKNRLLHVENKEIHFLYEDYTGEN